MTHSGFMVLLIHNDPDLDVIGSALLEKEYWLNEFKAKEVVIVGELTYKYSWLLEEGDIVKEIPKKWDNYHACVIDTATPKGLSAKQRAILKGACSVSIHDHHVSDESLWKDALNPDALVNYDSHPEFDSCCELLLDMIEDQELKRMSEKTLTGALAGIYAESNCLRDCNKETLKVVAKLIESGADFEKVLHNCNKTIATWPKLEYMAKVVLRKKIYSQPGIIALHSWYSDYMQHNFNVTRHKGIRKPPIYILALLRRENIKFKANMNAYVLFYDRQDGSKKKITIVVELIRWSRERQEELARLGFGIIRVKQYRYYMNVSEAEADKVADSVAEALIKTNSTNLELL